MKIKDLKPKYRGKALLNLTSQRDNDITIKTAFNMGIGAAFNWEDSNEGYDYWENIYTYGVHKQKLK